MTLDQKTIEAMEYQFQQILFYGECKDCYQKISGSYKYFKPRNAN